MGVVLSDLAKRLVDEKNFATVATINPDGSPQSSVVWIKRDGDDLIFSTIRGRRKTKNIERDPRVSVVIYGLADPYVYVEVRGTVSLVEDGGPELINELSLRYTGEPFIEGGPDHIRVVCRISATKVIDG